LRRVFTPLPIHPSPFALVASLHLRALAPIPVFLDAFLDALVILSRAEYSALDFGRAENRFPRSNSGEEESPNTKGRDAA